MKLGSAGPSVMAWIGALLSSLCCLLPLTVIVLGLGSGAFMAVTMRYRWVLIPAGVVGVTTGFALYVRERRRCDALACRMVGRRATLSLLIIASLVVATSIVLAVLLVLFLLHAALAGPSTVVLTVEGMT